MANVRKKLPKAGAIVQIRGHGQAMVVSYTERGDLLDMPGIKHAAMCEWTEEKTLRHETYNVNDLEVVGTVYRLSQNEIYEWLTARAIGTVRALAAEGKPEMARGAVRMWFESVGPMAADEDYLRLQKLVEGEKFE